MWRIYILVVFLAFSWVGCNPGVEEHIKNGMAKCAKEDHKGAIADFTIAIESDPKLDSAYLKRGMCRAHLGEFKASIEDFDKTIELNPKKIMKHFSKEVAPDLTLVILKAPWKITTKRSKLIPKMLWQSITERRVNIILVTFQDRLLTTPG